jgi:type IV secretory system conjugative DNA transfer VirD4/TraG family protein/YWFCY motif protein
MNTPQTTQNTPVNPWLWMTLISVAILAFHFYYSCIDLFHQLKLPPAVFLILDRFVDDLVHKGLLRYPMNAKLIALAFAAFAIFLDQNKSRKTFRAKRHLILLAIGAGCYFGEEFIQGLDGSIQFIGITYILVTVVGYFLIYIVLHNLIPAPFSKGLAADRFNKLNETFPQEEKRLINPFSINLKARYRLSDDNRSSWINVINPFRGTGIYGIPGSGKSHFIIRPFIEQSLQKGFTLFVYDFKFPELTRITYNNLILYQDSFPVKPRFYILDFDHLAQSSRCNPLDPSSMSDISDAAESARTILLALNRDWIRRQGDFFIESAVSFVTAAMWFLCRYEDGRYCTLPHLIEFIQQDYAKLFSVLRSVPEVETMIGSFVSLFEHGTMETLDSQVASAKIALSKLASPRLYYVLSGNDFTLDINNPQEPKVVCMGSNPQKKDIYGAAMSLYITRMIKLVNRANQLPCHIIVDELPTIYINDLPNLLATARGNKVAVTFAAQSNSQLRDAYGQHMADVLFTLPGNIFCGQATGDTAKAMSETIGRIVQTKSSISDNDRNRSYSESENLAPAVPPSTIAGLSSGEFVGYVADNPDQKIRHKAFHGEILVNNKAIRKQEERFLPLPAVRKEPTPDELENNYAKIKVEVAKMVSDRLETMKKSPILASKIIIKPGLPPQNRQKPPAP